MTMGSMPKRARSSPITINDLYQINSPDGVHLFQDGLRLS